MNQSRAMPAVPSSLKSRSSARLFVRAVYAILFVIPISCASAADQVEVWEYSPYRVQIHFAFDSTVPLSDATKVKFAQDLSETLDRSFRAAWKTELVPANDAIGQLVRERIDALDVAQLLANDLVVVVSQSSAELKAARTVEALAVSNASIKVSDESRMQYQRAIKLATLAADHPLLKLQEKLAVESTLTETLLREVESGQCECAIVRIADAERMKNVRRISLPLPSQPSTLIDQLDKLFLLRVSMRGDRFLFTSRELDCPMRFWGPTFDQETPMWHQAARAAAFVVEKSFAPVARVEEADSVLAELRQRAGGLIMDQFNPASFHTGDVVQPIVRRDDRNGNPTLLQALPWTFATITANDGVKMDAVVLTYSGGPGLQGRQNRRTQRLVLKVRPKFQSTEIQLVAKGNRTKAMVGCAIYKRDLLNDEYVYLGRADWDGRVSITVPEDFRGVYSHEVRAARLAQKRQQLENLQAGNVDQDGNPPAAESFTSESNTESTVDTESYIPLRAPLVQLYVKNGDTVLAKLPMVVGLSDLEVAELPDDSKRLEAEAFVNGFQGDVLDLIGLRKVLASQVQYAIGKGNQKLAEESMEKLRKLPSYSEMADRLNEIQRQILESRGDVVPAFSMGRIDRMFQTTRDLMQKFLQDNLVAETEAQLATFRRAAIESENATSQTGSDQAVVN